MEDVTLTMDETVVHRARAAAAQAGKTLSEFVTDLVERNVEPSSTQKQAMERFLAGPPLHLLDGQGRAPSRDELNARSSPTSILRDR